MGRPGQRSGGHSSGSGSRSSSGHRAGSSHSTYRSNSSSSSSTRRSVSSPSSSSRPLGGFGERSASSPSSSSRPSGGFSSGPRPPMGHGGPHMPPPPPPRQRTYYGGGTSLRGCFSTMLSLISLVAIVVVLLGLSSCLNCVSCFSCFGMKPSYDEDPIRQPSQSVVQQFPSRSKITPLKSFDPNCVVDQCGWTDNAKAAGASLRKFYDRTGIQPYVLFKSYDSKINTETKKHNWADDYFVKQLGNNPTAVLLVYFCEEDEADDGWCELIIGDQAGEFVDAEATDIFWGLFDDEWYSDVSTDEVICNIFNRFADACLR